MKKFLFGCAAALCAAGILVGIWFMLLPLWRHAAGAGGDTYYLRDKGGRVAVYTADNAQTPLAVYDIYVNLLPEGDVLRLKNGISVEGDAALETLLEDLGA